MTDILSSDQKEAFWRDGAIVVEHAVTAEQLRQLRDDFSTWVAESRNHAGPYGQLMDGRPRFDVEPGHTRDKPALRRVGSPTEISAAHWGVIQHSRMTDMVAELIGPNVRFHHSKINSKLPGTATAVKWHQDFLYDPHTNADLITALLFVDEVTMENGPLQITPGSHKGPLYSLWHDGRFTGAIAENQAVELEANSIACTGPAGAVCLMHSRVAHASKANLSARSRTLFISVMAAADALPLAPNPVPSRHAGILLRGEEPRTVRASAFEMDLPEYPKGASFFTQQQAVA